MREAQGWNDRCENGKNDKLETLEMRLIPIIVQKL